MSSVFVERNPSFSGLVEVRWMDGLPLLSLLLCDEKKKLRFLSWLPAVVEMLNQKLKKEN